MNLWIVFAILFCYYECCETESDLSLNKNRTYYCLSLDKGPDSPETVQAKIHNVIFYGQPFKKDGTITTIEYTSQPGLTHRSDGSDRIDAVRIWRPKIGKYEFIGQVNFPVYHGRNNYTIPVNKTIQVISGDVIGLLRLGQNIKGFYVSDYRRGLIEAAWLKHQTLNLRKGQGYGLSKTIYAKVGLTVWYRSEENEYHAPSSTGADIKTTDSVRTIPKLVTVSTYNTVITNDRTRGRTKSNAFTTSPFKTSNSIATDPATDFTSERNQNLVNVQANSNLFSEEVLSLDTSVLIIIVLSVSFLILFCICLRITCVHSKNQIQLQTKRTCLAKLCCVLKPSNYPQYLDAIPYATSTLVGVEHTPEHNRSDEKGYSFTDSTWEDENRLSNYSDPSYATIGSNGLSDSGTSSEYLLPVCRRNISAGRQLAGSNRVSDSRTSSGYLLPVCHQNIPGRRQLADSNRIFNSRTHSDYLLPVCHQNNLTRRDLSGIRSSRPDYLHPLSWSRHPETSSAIDDIEMNAAPNIIDYCNVYWYYNEHTILHVLTNTYQSLGHHTPVQSNEYNTLNNYEEIILDQNQ